MYKNIEHCPRRAVYRTVNRDEISYEICFLLHGVRKSKLLVSQPSVIIISSHLCISQGLKESGLLQAPHHRTPIEHFVNPYNELFLWAVLCNMQKMALFMWERGDNSLARAMIGGRIYMEMAGKIEGDELRNDVYEQVIKHAQ